MRRKSYTNVYVSSFSVSLKPLLDSSILVQRQPETIGEWVAGKTSFTKQAACQTLSPGVTVYWGKLWVLSGGGNSSRVQSDLCEVEFPF